MQIAFKRVAEDDALVVTMLAQQGLQIERRSCQRFDRKGDVLNDDGGASAAHGADRGKGALAHFPVHLADAGIGREFRWLDGIYTLQGGYGGVDLQLQRRLGLGAHFDQQGCSVDPERTHDGRQTGLVFNRTQGRAVQQLNGRDRFFFQPDHGLAGERYVRKEHQCAGLAGVLDDGLVSDARDEAERAFRADHQVRQDVDAVFKIDQGVQAVAGGVLDLVLVANARGQCGVSAGRCTQRFKPVDQGGVGLAELRHGCGIFGVEQAAVGQNDAHAFQRLVTVLRGAAAHAGGVVGGNAADLAGVDGSRVGPDLATEGCQTLVDHATDHARADANRAGVGGDLAAGKSFTNQGQHAVRDGLSRQAGAPSAKGHRLAVAARRLQQRHNFFLGLDDGDHFGRQAVKAGVGAIGQQPQLFGDHLPGWQDA